MTLETQTDNKQEQPLIEMPVYMQAELAANALAAASVAAEAAQDQRDETAAIAEKINDTRPEGFSPTLPSTDEQPAHDELTASTVRSNTGVKYP